ncbi:hypothetical protein BDW02DRAFT_353163 [Decorospora gaudefroyi]|uniref:Apple domain-containing protein n=1 Tax=Decorospora gaudefroyi TaxID=184978 RepID=A0A6A5KCQ7_9PLEO|nr:hypothetical protein BDW02DRAFT_353163 [Decorospora gaudefroyi]
MHGVFLATSALAAFTPRQLSSGINCPGNPICPRWEGCVATSTSGSVYRMHCFNDFNGPIISVTQAALFVDCADSCAYHEGCQAFNHKDGFCYLLGENIGSSRTVTNGNAGVQIKTATPPQPSIGATTCSIPVVCPMEDGCIHSVGDKTYAVRCNYDYYGGDIAYKSTPNLSECADACTDTPGCVKVTWTSGSCYLKNDKTTTLYHSWTDSAYILELSPP